MRRRRKSHEKQTHPPTKKPRKMREKTGKPWKKLKTLPEHLLWNDPQSWLQGLYLRRFRPQSVARMTLVAQEFPVHCVHCFPLLPPIFPDSSNAFFPFLPAPCFRLPISFLDCE
mmetsp:Transcript_31093/g.65987  ORF Transcript_31093/g.65987 Transcript_31093/m.65987 type:complete len:114 (-) Transcript_31093:59-400(-)